MSDWSWQPAPDCGITVRRQIAGEIDYELAEAGSGDRLALMLHGFPELNYSWRHQMPMLAARGWRVWAPNLRGYGSTTRPEGVRNYALDKLTGDVAALIDASGAKEVMIVAHDWGAVIAWAFAAMKLRPISKLVIMNVPHPRIMARELRQWRQLRKSWYIYFFQLPWLPEHGLARNDAAVIKRMFHGMAIDKSRFPAEALDHYAHAALRPGALTAMVNYYRALLRFSKTIKIGSGRIETPTLMIWGEEDAALNINCTVGTQEWVPNLTLHRLPMVSHWVQQEAPERVNELMGEWLDTPY